MTLLLIFRVKNFLKNELLVGVGWGGDVIVFLLIFDVFMMIKMGRIVKITII